MGALTVAGGSPAAALQGLAGNAASAVAAQMPAGMAGLKQLAAGALPGSPQFSAIPTAPALLRLGALAQARPGDAQAAASALLGSLSGGAGTPDLARIVPRSQS